MPHAYSSGSGQPIYGGRSAPSSVPSWVAAQPLWTWFDVPTSALSSVEPADALSNLIVKGDSGPSQKITAWNGAALKRKGSMYIMAAAGGHKDYLGNEVDGIVLNSETPHWVELRAHSDPSMIYNGVAVYGDNRKASQHTYWFTQYDNTNDRVIICSSGGPFESVNAPAMPTGYAYPKDGPPYLTPAFDMASSDWLAPLTMPQMPYAPQGGDLCCMNKATGEIYVNTTVNSTLIRRDPTTGVWSNVGHWFFGGYTGAAVDPKRGRILAVGDYGGTTAPTVRSTVDASAVSVTFGGIGLNPASFAGTYPGVEYDETNDTFLIAANNKTTNLIDIYRVDANSYAVDMPAITGTIALRTNGIHNSFQYVPELRAVVIANSYTGNMKMMRTSL